MNDSWIKLFKDRYPPPAPATMTEAAALQEARKRWPNGSILKGDRQKGEAPCIVGWIDPEAAVHPLEMVRWSAFVVRGIGMSWEDAFLDADCKDKTEIQEKQHRRKKKRSFLDHLNHIS